MGASLGKVIGKVAAGLGIAAAGLATGGLAWAAGASVFGAVSAAASVGLMGAQYLMGGGSSSTSSWLPFMLAQQQASSQGAASKGQPPVPLKKTIRQSDVPRCFIFGRTKTAGSYFFYETDMVVTTTAGAPDVKALNLYQGIYLCDGPIDGFDTILCDDEALDVGSTGDGKLSDSLDGDNNVFIPRSGTKYIRTNTTLVTTTNTWNEWVYGPVCVHVTWVWYWYPYSGAYVCDKYENQWHWEQRSSSTTALQQININESSCIAFEPVVGSEDGYQSFILNRLMLNYSGSVLSGFWDDTHTGKGITCLYTFCSNNPGGTSNRLKYFPNGWPEWAAVVRGARVYDPRDASQDYTDAKHSRWSIYNVTWKWTENPALIAAHFISWLIEEGTTSITGVDWESIIVAANDCDTLKPTTQNYFGSGESYEPFARVSGVYYFNTPPREFLSNIMASCDGTYGIDKDGRFTMWIGKWEDAAVTFDESDISSFTEEFVEAASEAINEFHITYTEPRQGYQKFEAPTWIDNDSQLAVGKRISSISFDMVPSANQAYRLAQRHARRINGKKKLTITLGPRGMLAIKQRVVGLDAPNFGLSGTWRVESLTPDGSLRQWQATLREIDRDVFADDKPAIDPITKVKVVAQNSITAPLYYSATPTSSGGGKGHVIISADVNSYDATGDALFIFEQAFFQDQTLDFDAQYSTNGGGTWTAVNIMVSRNTLQTPDLMAGTSVSVRTRWVSLNGTVSAWSDMKTVVIP